MLGGHREIDIKLIKWWVYWTECGADLQGSLLYRPLWADHLGTYYGQP